MLDQSRRALEVGFAGYKDRILSSGISSLFMNLLSCFILDTVAKFGRVLKPRVQNFAKNASVEMVPPAPGEFVKEVNISKVNIMSGKSLARVFDLTVNELTAIGLVIAEVAFCFYIGEMIGRRSIIGYNPKV